MRNANCIGCNKLFVTKYSLGHKTRGKFCGLICSNASRKGKKLTEAHRTNISIGQLRIGNKPPTQIGETHWAWKGGVSKDPEHQKKRWRDYQAKNYDKVLVKNTARHSRKCKADGSYTLEEWVDLKERCKNSCLSCSRTDTELTVDHIVPLSKGGSNYITNIQPLCKSCNSKKGTKTINFKNICPH